MLLQTRGWGCQCASAPISRSNHSREGKKTNLKTIEKAKKCFLWQKKKTPKCKSVRKTHSKQWQPFWEENPKFKRGKKGTEAFFRSIFEFENISQNPSACGTPLDPGNFGESNWESDRELVKKKPKTNRSRQMGHVGKPLPTWGI